MHVVDRGVTTAAFALRVVEAMLTVGAVYIALLFLADREISIVASAVVFAIAVAVTVLAMMHLTGLYGVGMLTNLRVALTRLALVTAFVFVLAVVTTGVLAHNDIAKIYPYRWQWTLTLTAVWLGCVFMARILLKKLIERGYFARSIIAATNEKDSVGLGELAQMFPGRFVVVAHLAHVGATSGQLTALSTKRAASEIILSARDELNGAGDGFSQEKLRGAHIPVTNYGAFYEREAGRVDLDNLKAGWLAQARGAQSHPFETAFRRCFDVAVALMAFVIAAPVMALVALAIRIEDGKPILFRQTRVGLGGKEFTLFKFRSMRADAEDGAVPVWAADNDPRITRVGWFIRKLRIDELPQFYNVLRGDMSFIGPRPERPYFVQQLTDFIPFYSDRHIVKPGITGWAQVSFHYGASFEDARHKTAYDLYYVKNRSILLDLVIIARTVKVVLWPQGVR